MQRTRTDPRTPAERARIAEGRKRAWQKAKEADSAICELSFHLLLDRGITTDVERAAALGLLDRALENSALSPARRRSLQTYRDALTAGRRVVVKTYQADDGPPNEGEGVIPGVLAQLAACL